MVGVSLPSGSFTPVPAALPAGRTPTDISHTWDGVLHAIDQSGEPYVYDRVQQAWTAVGTGIDAVARVGNLIYHFRGSEYLTCEFGSNLASAPVAITQTWPGLPRSFQLGVCGAASLDGKLYLFAQGRYVCVDQPDAVFALADLTGWPTAPAWADGLIDGTFSLGGDQVLVFRGGEWVTCSISESKVLVTAPTPLTDFGPFRANGVPAEVLGPGFRGGFTYQDGPPGDGQPMTIYCGTTVLAYSGRGLDLSGYLPAIYSGWPAAWHPQLAHAFSGRSGALWSATQGGQLVSLAADGFHAQPQQAGQVSAGADGSVYFTDPAGTSVHTLGGPDSPVYTSPTPIKELSHGRSGELWALDSTGNAVRVSVSGPGAAASPQAMFQAQSISANADGSVWHIGTDGQPARYTDTGGSEVLPGAPAAGLVGSNRAGHGYVVSGAAAGDPDGLTIHEYTSPFLFKTVGMPQTRVYDSRVAYGGGRVFYCTYEPPPQENRIIACDYASGDVVWTQSCHANDQWDAVAYSADLDCLFAVSPNSGISAFRASDGTPFSPASNVFSDNPANAISVDGSFAATLYPSDGCTAWDLQTGQKVWGFAVPGNTRPATPIITEQYVFYLTDYTDNLGCTLRRSVRDAEGLNPPVTLWSDQGTATDNHWSLLRAPLPSLEFTGDEGIYFVDGSGNIMAMPFDGGPNFVAVPAQLIGQGPVQITSGLSYAEGCIWFGCSIGGRGALVGLDLHNGLSLVPHTPFFPDAAATAVVTSPLFYRNAQGQPLVVFGTKGVAKLWAFNPADGSFGSIDTMGTEIDALTADAPLGTVRCGGAPPQGTTDLTAYYGIRLDGIPLTAPPQYSLIADSQLLQDPDPAAVNQGSSSPDNPIPPSAARYQTHLTVVDTSHVPVPNLEVKLYVDQATAAVPLTVQGQATTVPPSGLVVTTDATGKITVVSEASQLTTAALRVWAPFMDNSERMVVHPDHEFHQRVMTAHADASNSDPDKVNLVTAQDYNANSYFTDQEKSRGAPLQTASAVQQLGGAVGVGVGTPAPLPGRLGTAAAKYVTYADTGGLRYYPADTLAQRPLPPPAAAFALHIARAADGSLAQNVLSLHQAGAVIDGLQGSPWTPPSPAARYGAWWDDFWHWVTTEVEKVAEVIQQVVITVADTVQVAIQVLDNGIRKVVHFVVKELEDAVKTIGSLFIQLGKLILHTIEALSLLFNFGEILKTHQLIQDAVERFIHGDKTNPQTFPGLATAIKNTAIPALTSYVSRGDQEISNVIDELKSKLTGQPLSQLKGQGSTEHTAYQPPSNASNPVPTHAVQGSWGSDAMKRNLPNASVAITASAVANQTGNPLQDFLDGFLAGLSGGGQYEAAANQLKSDFTHMFTSTRSASDFLATAVDALLDLIKLLLESILGLAGGICSGALAALADMIDDIYNLLTAQIDIPFISWLYTKLTGEPLTILGAALFVVAIPATVLFRAITGKNPSQALAPPPAGTAALDDGAPVALQVLCGIVSAFSGLIAGMINGIADQGDADLDPGPALLVASLSVAGLVASNPWLSSNSPADGDIGRFVASIPAAFVPVLAAFVVSGKVTITQAEKIEIPDTMAIIGCLLGIAIIAATVVAIVETKPSYGEDLAFALGIAGAVPSILGILKVRVINEAIEKLGGPIVGVVEIIEAFALTTLQLWLVAMIPPTLSRELPAAQPA